VTVSSISSSTGAGGRQAASNAGLSALDGGAFMEVLLAQLRHQNPLQPMDDKDLIGQMAQLNSLQELQKINSALEKLVDLSRPDES
jgi:flagellar basal-body rod modification protein FlgD